MIKKVLGVLLAAMVSMAGLTSVYAADEAYPSKPITGIVQASAGGSTDLLARAVEKIWTKYSKQPLVIVNKPGGGGVVGAKFVADAKPDGYTIYMGYGSGECIVMPHLVKKMAFEPFKDLVAVSRLSVHSVVICTGAKSEFNSLKDLIAWSKKNDKPILAAASVKNGAQDLALQAFAKYAGVKLESVPFAGGNEAVTALAGGHVMISAAHPSEALPHIKAGRFKPLGISIDKRDPLLPKVPTFKEQGVNVVVWGSVKGVAVPANTPAPVIKYLETTFKKVTSDPEYKKILNDLGQPNLYLNGKDFAKYLQTVFKDYGKLIKELKIETN